MQQSCILLVLRLREPSQAGQQRAEGSVPEACQKTAGKRAHVPGRCLAVTSSGLCVSVKDGPFKSSTSLVSACFFSQPHLH